MSIQSLFMAKASFRKWVKISLVLVYMVIIAGALVRMTGSGMGCPDWPKCFGYYIPPTDVRELLFSPNHEFKKGQVIIHEEKLFVAKSTFTTSESIDLSNWEPYTKHDYATFNVFHTWTEYLNRLCGALAGIACFIMALYSIRMWRYDKIITWLSWLVVFMMGFQAWLGATVVYSVLNPIRITLHMVMALVIVAVIIYILYRVKDNYAPKKSDSQIRTLLIGSIILSLIQVVLGTQVREFVDHQLKEIGHEQIHQALANPDLAFYIHRTFTFVVITLPLLIFFRNRKLQLGYNKINWVLLLLLIEIISGMAMYYLGFPFGMQTTHLVIASILFGVQFYMILESTNKSSYNKA